MAEVCIRTYIPISLYIQRWPTQGRSGRVLVHHGVDTVLPETIREGQDPVLVFRGIVAIADEYFGRSCGFQDLIILQVTAEVVLTDWPSLRIAQEMDSRFGSTG